MPGSRARLLIIDDEKALMKALCDTLEAEGYQTSGFTSAHDALATLAKESFDLVLTDLMMPEMDGISVLDAAFQIDSNLVGIVMTGHGSVNTAVNALQTGAVDYILKPFKVNTLLPILTRALAARRLRMENIQLREAVGLYELSLAIASARDSETVLEKVADAAFEQSDARALYVLLSTGTGRLRAAAIRGAAAAPVAGTSVPLDARLEAWAEGFSGAGVLPEPELIEQIPPGLTIPMLNAGKLLGVLHFEPPQRQRAFTLGQRKALSILANTSASALAAADGVERLRGAEQRYRRLSEDAPDVVSRFELDPRLACTYVNPAVLAVTGYAPEDFYSNANLALEITHPDDRPLVAKVLAGDLPSGSTYTLRWLNKTGTVAWVEQRVALVHDRHDKVTAIETVSRDITERRNLEEQLRHSQKLEAIGKLTAGVAHDFNNLLTIINGYAALALTEATPGSGLSRKLDQIKKAGDQAASLTNQLLTFSRKQVTQPKTINLAMLLDEMAPMIHRIAGDPVAVTIGTETEPGAVKIDPTQAQQVILNLAVNARDAMADGGRLEFTLSNIEAQQVRGRVAQIADGRYVMLAVTDTGCGMPPEVSQRIFEPFFTTKGLGRGTGLGLATVYGIVEQSGGHIYLDSEVGVGTTFTILLPCSDEPVQAKPVDTVRESGGSETILVLDDDAGVRGFAQDALTAAGYTVLAAADGPEAIRLAAVHAEEIELFLTDMMLQGMQGNVVAEKIRCLLPHAKILFMSGYTEHALPDGAAFIDKPFKPEQLTNKVRDMLDLRVPEIEPKRVLVVDDESSIRSLLKHILEEAGFEVLAAANGREAQKQFDARPFDLVITDLMMPEMDGIEFINAMRKQWPDVKLVATSGEASQSLLRAAQLLGAHATLAKPLDAESILSCVRELV